jgi:diguanylate cyclase (GGDEF)-like protein
MSMQKIKIRRLRTPQIAVVVLALGASLAGSLSALSGSLVLSIGTAFFIAALCLVFFLFVYRAEASGSSAGGALIPDTPVLSSIPPDRIDPLTGLANENGLMAWFSERGAKLAADGKGIVLLVADLADFDQIERARGKDIADAVLIEVSKRVATCTGDDGIASRNSGDQFAAVATVVPTNSAEVAAEQAGKLAELLQRPVELPSGVVWIGGSVGAAYGSPLEGANVLSRARKALDKAKRIGRGHYIVDNAQKPE